MNYKIVLIGLVISTSSAMLVAKRSDQDQPIRILTDSATANPGAKQIELIGNIDIQQGSLLIRANKVTYIQTKSEKYITINAHGNPASFQQLLNSKNKQGKNQLAKARANHITYNSKTGNIDMQGEAYLNINGNEMFGDKINYSTTTEKYTVRSEKNKRVSVVLHPKN